MSTDLNVSSASLDATTTEGVAEVGSTPETASESKLAPQDDPNESFQDWVKRTKAEKEEKTESDTKATPERDASGKFVSKSLEKETQTTEPAVKDQELPKSESSEPELKVGDKVYKPKDIEELSAAHSQVSQEMQNLKDRIRELGDTLSKDPGAVLDALPELNQEALAKWYYEKYVRPETMSVEEKLAAAEARLKQREEQEKLAKEESQRVEQETVRQSQVKALNDLISRDLTEAGVPVTEFTIAKMATYVKEAHASGQKIEPSKLASKVRDDLAKLQADTMKSLPADKLIEALGPETLAKLRAHDAEKFKQTKFENKVKTPEKVSSGKKDEPRKAKYTNPYQLLDDIK